MIRTTPQKWDAFIYAGQTFDWTWTVTDDTGQPLDLTGVNVRAQLRQTVTDGTAIATFGTANATVILGGTAGTIRFFQSDTVTAALGAAVGNTQVTAVFDAEAVEFTGDVSRIISGNWTIVPEVTR